MKKSLFALAALSAFATTAQAQSSVSIYGNLDATEAYQSAGVGKSYALTAAANSTSLWGLTGSEDLGSGMKMGFDLKSEINLATGATGSGTNVPPTTSFLVTALGTVNTTAPTNVGTSNLFNRGANIFISSASLGELKLGRMDDIEWATAGAYSTSGSNSFGSNQGHAQIGNMANTGMGVCRTGSTFFTGNGICSTMGQTANNVNTYQGTADAFMTGIQYTTPTFAGFSAKVQTGLGANSATATESAGNTTGYGLFYTGLGGNLNAAFSQSLRYDDNGQLGLTITNIGAKYKAMPAVTLIGNWTQTGLSNSTVGNIGLNGANAGNTMYSFGVNYQVSPAIDMNVAYTTITGDTQATSTSATNGSINGSANSVNMWGVTGRYNFSKRTQLYAGIGQSNNSGAYFMSPIYGGVTMAGTTAGTGASIFASMIGLKHSF